MFLGDAISWAMPTPSSFLLTTVVVHDNFGPINFIQTKLFSFSKALKIDKKKNSQCKNG